MKKIYIIIIFLISIKANATILDTALQEYQKGTFENAYNYFQLALKSGENNSKQLETIWMHIGIIETASGNFDSAQTAFIKLLTLNPNPSLPPDASPLIIEKLNSAKTFIGNRRFNITDKAPQKIYKQFSNSILLEINNDISQIAHKAILSINEHESGIIEINSSKIEVAIPRDIIAEANSKLISYSLKVTDEFGNEVWRSASKEIPIITDETEDRVAENSCNSIYCRWWFWTIVGVVIVGAGVGTTLAITKPFEEDINAGYTFSDQ